MSELKIITNNVPRDVIYGHELTDEERAEFDYIDWNAVERGDDDQPEFVRYKGQLYDLGDMTLSPIDGWDAIVNETFFSGVLFRWPRMDSDGRWRRVPLEPAGAEVDSEHIICGRYYT